MSNFGHRPRNYPIRPKTDPWYVHYGQYSGTSGPQYHRQRSRHGFPPLPPRTYSRNNRTGFRRMGPMNSFIRPMTSGAKPCPEVRRILDAFQTTLDRASNHYDNEDLKLLQFDPKTTSLSQIYGQHKEDVKEFFQSLQFLSGLPQHEVEDNMKNWMDVMVFRSCWWYSLSDEDQMDVIRVGDCFGLHRSSDKSLEGLFSMAETVSEMHLTSVEAALVCAYLILMGTTSFQTNVMCPSETAKRRGEVLNMIFNHQRDHFPTDTLRYARLLTHLSDMTFIAKSG